MRTVSRGQSKDKGQGERRVKQTQGGPGMKTGQSPKMTLQGSFYLLERRDPPSSLDLYLYPQGEELGPLTALKL